MVKYFSEVVENNAKTRPDHLAYIFMGQETTYKEYNEDINRIANSFLGLGLKPGDKIATLLPQSPAFMNIYMAAATMGLVVVPLDPRFTASEMAALCERTTPNLLISLAYPENIKNNAEDLIRQVHFDHVYSYFGAFDYEGSKPYETLLESSSDPVPENIHPCLDDPLIIIFTSGSTGTPKGAVISHKNTYAISKATVDAWEITCEDRVLVNMPTSHVGGTHDLITVQLYAGATGIITPTFNPEEMLDFIGKYKISFTGGVPTMYRLIFKNCNVGDYDSSSVRTLVVSGEPSPPELIHTMKDNFPNANVVASWGMTETAGFFTFTKPTDTLETVASTEGKPGEGFEMKILKDDESWAKAGEIGELLVKGDSVISSYMDENDNKDAFYKGWLRTGDLGYMDEDNYLHYVGRSKEMYISGGYNVYPLEIESYLNAYPGINTSAIIEIPAEIWGEVGYAFVVPEEGVDLDVEEIKKYCKQGLADYKQPKKIIIRKDIPKTLIGKIAKQEIRKDIKKYIE